MDAEAQKRKERLAALRKRKEQSSGDRSTTEAEKTLRFRNYTPQDEKLKEHAQISTPDDIKDNIESETKNFTKEALAQAAEKEKEEVDLFNLAPKKPNWDLKRDVEKKLDKLERQTQRAIYQIIRTRLEADENANLADIVANGVAEQNIQDVEE